jgi:hypothetical protein
VRLSTLLSAEKMGCIGERFHGFNARTVSVYGKMRPGAATMAREKGEMTKRGTRVSNIPVPFRIS